MQKVIKLTVPNGYNEIIEYRKKKLWKYWIDNEWSLFPWSSFCPSNGPLNNPLLDCQYAYVCVVHAVLVEDLTHAFKPFTLSRETWPCGRRGLDMWIGLPMICSLINNIGPLKRNYCAFIINNEYIIYLLW